MGESLAWENLRIDFPGGDLQCEVAGQGLPILLVHSINAAASRCEMRPLAEELALSRRVYNLDLPGFGKSARPNLRYDIARFVAAIDAAMAQIRVWHGEQRVDAIALSLSAEFLARSVVMSPQGYRSLVFISPTGFEKGAESRQGAAGNTLERPWMTRAIDNDFVGRALYKGLTLPASIRFFLSRTFGTTNIDERLYRCAVEASQYAGAHHAPLAFLTGRLFAGDIANIYRAVHRPVLLAHGTRGAFSDFSAAAWTRDRPNWTSLVYDTGAMPHVEKPREFSADVMSWLQRKRSDSAVDQSFSKHEPASH